MEVTAACAGGICLCGCSQRRGRQGWRCVPVGFASADVTSAEVTGGAGGRAPVGFGPQRSSDNAGSFVRRWDLSDSINLPGIPMSYQVAYAQACAFLTRPMF